MNAEHPLVDPAPATPTGAMIRTLGLVSAICGLIIVGAYQGTYDAVAANKRIAMERAVFKVVPAAKSIQAYHALADGRVEPAGAETPPAGALRFFAGYDAAREQAEAATAPAGARKSAARWSEHAARQLSAPEQPAFATWLRTRGFDLG